MEQLRYTATAGKKAGATSFPGHNLDWRTQIGPIEEGQRGEDWDREDIFMSCELYMHFIYPYLDIYPCAAAAL